jgi:hypothetical protein
MDCGSGSAGQNVSEILSQKNKSGIVVHTCNPCYSGGRDRRTKSSQAHVGKSVRPYLKNKRTGVMAQLSLLKIRKKQKTNSLGILVMFRVLVLCARF